MHEAKTQLSRLAERASLGEEVIIAKAGKPYVKMVAYQPSQQPRVPGLLADSITISEDAFSAETDRVIQKMFDDSINSGNV